MANSPFSIEILSLLPISVIVWLLLSFTSKRKDKLVNLCYGRPAIVAPINFLTPRHRVVYSLACAAQCSLWLELLFKTLTADIDVDKYLGFIVKAIILVLLVFMVTVVTYPMVACIDAPVSMIGYGLGLTYCLTYFSVKIYYITDSFIDLEDPPSIVYAIVITGFVPQFVCIAAINVWYAYMIIKGLIHIKKSISNETHRMSAFFKAFIRSKIPDQKNIDYVKRLLNKEEQSTFISYIKKIDIPLPLSIAATVSIVLILQSTIIVTFVYQIIIPVFVLIFDSDDFESDDFKRSLQAIFALGPILAAAISIGILIHLLYSVQKEIIQIRKGKGPFIDDIHDQMTALKLTSSARYAGYQTASFITGWLFYTIAILIIGLFIVMVRFAPNIFGFTLYILTMTGLSIGVVLFVQFIVCKFSFFRSPENQQKSTLVIDNRKVYESYTYFILLFSVATGLFTSTLRILTAIVLTLIMKPRLDKIVFVKPFQKIDTGHSMYKAFITTEALLNNPVVNAFVELAMSMHSQTSTDTTNTRFQNLANYRAIKRWHLAYTLIRNPELKKERRNSKSHYLSRVGLPRNFEVTIHNVNDTNYRLYSDN